MRWETKLRDTCVYWAPNGPDKYGQQTFRTPVEVVCRWEDRVEEDLKSPDNKATIKTWVFTIKPLRELGAIKRGKLSQVTDQAEPFKNSNTFEIRTVKEIDSLDNDQVLYTYIL